MLDDAEAARRSRWTAESIVRRSDSVWRAGADTFVAGNAIFSAPDMSAEIVALHRLCEEQT